jgi:hypothetical protein
MESFSLALPHSTVGLEKFLGSGLSKASGQFWPKELSKNSARKRSKFWMNSRKN